MKRLRQSLWLAATLGLLLALPGCTLTRAEWAGAMSRANLNIAAENCRLHGRNCARYHELVARRQAEILADELERRRR